MVVTHSAYPAVVSLILNFAVPEINILDFLGSASHGRQNPSERRRQSMGVNRGSRDLGQKRIEHHVVFRIEYHQLAGFLPKRATQGLRALDPAKPSADDDDP